MALLKIKNLFSKKSLNALEQTLQLISMPLTVLYFTSTGMFWLWAIFLIIPVSFLITLPFALMDGLKVFIKETSKR